MALRSLPNHLKSTTYKPIPARKNNYKEPKLTVYEREAGRVCPVCSAHGSLFNKTMQAKQPVLDVGQQSRAGPRAER